MADEQAVPITDQQALEAIERLCGDDFCCVMEMQMCEAVESPLKTAVDKLMKIYTISHSLVRSNVCFHVHTDWRKQAAETYAALMAKEANAS